MDRDKKKRRIAVLTTSRADSGHLHWILHDLSRDARVELDLIAADRYEMLAPASVALALRIPIAHIEGGESSEGAIDDAVRNALTKMSHIHFTCTEAARQRVIAMGEEDWRVHFTEALPSISCGVIGY